MDLHNSLQTWEQTLETAVHHFLSPMLQELVFTRPLLQSTEIFVFEGPYGPMLVMDIGGAHAEPLIVAAWVSPRQFVVSSWDCGYKSPDPLLNVLSKSLQAGRRFIQRFAAYPDPIVISERLTLEKLHEYALVEATRGVS